MKPYPAYKSSGVPWLGRLPSHWVVEKLKYVVEFVGGGTPSKDEDDYWGGSIPWVSPKDMKRAHITDTEDYITAAGLVASPCSPVPIGSVLVVVRSGILKHTIPVAVNQVVVTLNQDMRAMVPADGIESRFLAYQIEGCQGELLDEWVKQGATVESVEHQRMADTRLTWPPLREQQDISDHLDANIARIDELIREKNGLIGLLREFRQAVIADHTTGFNRPGARTRTGNVFCPSVPRGWAMVRLGKYSRIGNGSTPLKDNAEYWQGGTYPWLNSAVVNQDEVFEGSDFVTAEALRACHLPIVDAGAVLVALIGQGKTRGKATMLRIRATISQNLAFITLDGKHFNTDYVFWTLAGMYDELRMVSDGQGGAQGALTCEDLSRFEVPMPPLAQQVEVAQTVARETARIDELIAHTKDEIGLLRELRSATIADAVLGRIDVRTLGANQA